MIGYIAHKTNYHVTAILIGVILGPLFEQYLVRVAAHLAGRPRDPVLLHARQHAVGAAGAVARAALLARLSQRKAAARTLADPRTRKQPANERNHVRAAPGPQRPPPRSPRDPRRRPGHGGRTTTPIIGHMKPPHGTTIIDVADPAHPRAACTRSRFPTATRTRHKVRVAGDIMITNVEQNNRHLLRRGARLPQAEAKLAQRCRAARPPTPSSLRSSSVKAEDIADVCAKATARGYGDGGFRIYDIADKRRPRLAATRRRTASASTASTWTRATPTSPPRWKATSATSW